jgi:hypothetical protein
MKLAILVVVLMYFNQHSFAQNFHAERIWKVSDRKKSIYLDQGIFHHPSKETGNILINVRNSYVANRGYERIVLDFSGANLPRVYGNISNQNKKIYIDLFNTSLGASITKLKNAKYVEKLDMFNIDKQMLSLELVLKEKVSFDIFYLTNPARLVIDIKK